MRRMLTGNGSRSLGLRAGVLALIIAGLAGCSDNSDPGVPNPLLGSWTVVRTDGYEVDYDMTWRFESRQLHVSMDGQELVGDYEYDLSFTPKRIDISFADIEPDPNPGIFRISGDTLTMKIVDALGDPIRAEDFTVDARGYDLVDLVRMSR